MVKGKLGIPRPLAVEKELLDVTFQGIDVTEATLDAANGFIVMGDRKPFFEIVNASSSPDEIAVHSVATSASLNADSFIDVWDIRLWANNLRTMDVQAVMPSDIEIRPSITTNRAFGITKDIPLLVLKITSNRGTHEKFTTAVEEEISKYDHLIPKKDEHNSGTHTYYVATYRGMQLNHILDIARSVLGPRNKRVTDIHLTTVGVGSDE